MKKASSIVSLIEENGVANGHASKMSPDDQPVALGPLQAFDLRFRPDDPNEYFIAYGCGLIARSKRYGVRAPSDVPLRLSVSTSWRVAFQDKPFPAAYKQLNVASDGVLAISV